MVFPAAALLLYIAAGQFDVDGFVAAETRVGQAPFLAGQPPRAGAIAVLTPGAQLRYISPTLELNVDSGVRTFWREPNDLGLDRPLFLSITNLTASSRVTRRFKVTAAASVSVGEPDYTELARILGPGQAALPQGITDVLAVRAAVRGEYAASRTVSVASSVEFTDRRALGEAGDAPPLFRRTSDTTASQEAAVTNSDVFPRQTSVLVNPSILALTSRRGGVLFSSPASYGTYAGGVDIFGVSPMLGWSGHVNKDLDLRLTVGLSYVNVLSVPAGQVTVTGLPFTRPSSTLSPAGDALATVLVFGQGQVALRSNTEAKVDYYVDPVLGAVTTRGLLVTGVSVTFAPSWILGLNGSFSTSLDKHALPGTPPPDETIAAVSLPAQHRLSQNLVMEFGARWADSGPHLSTSGLGFHQRQLWLYVMLTATSRRIPPWTVP